MAVTRNWQNLVRDPRATQTDPDGLLYWAVSTPLFATTALQGSGATPVPGVSTYATWDSDELDEATLFGSGIRTTVGGRVSVSVYGYTQNAGNAKARVSVYDHSTSSTAYIAVGASVPANAGEWARYTATVNLEPGDYTLAAGVVFDWETQAPGAIRATAAQITPDVDGLEYGGPYFDGSTADVTGATYSWLGAPNDSASLASIEVPQVTPQSVGSESATLAPIPLPVSNRVYKPLYLKDFSVQEDSTPIYASDSSGGAGTMTLQVDENGDTPYLVDVPIDLVDPSQGTTRGVIRNVSSDDTNASLVADSRLALLNVNRNATPYSGTLGGALRYYFGLCGITDDIVIEDSIDGIPVQLLGFSGNVWDALKQLFPPFRFEISLVSNNIVARPIRGNVSENYRDSGRGWAYDTAQKAQRVDIYQYTASNVSNGLIYPFGGWNSDVQVLSVEAGETAEFIIPVGGSLLEVDQPVYFENITAADPGFSAYNAIGSDNLPITRAQWEAQGGRLQVAISDDSRSLVVTITGPSETLYSPYSIAQSSGDARYSTLRLHGSAIMYTKELRSFHTGLDPDRVSQEVGAVIDNPAIQTDQQLLDVAMGELRYWGGNRRTISVSTNGINRLANNGSYSYAKFEDFDSWWDSNHPGATFGDFDAEAPPVFGSTFGEHDEWWIEEVQNDFANQAFGNISGARVRTESNFHRIRTATITPAGIRYTAWEDSIFGDHDALWDAALPGATFGDFDDKWAGRNFGEFDSTPLEAVNG